MLVMKCDAGNETDPLSGGSIHTAREQFAAISDRCDY
jgi:hypothetical protein